MTDLNPKVLEEKGAELQARMVKDLEGLDVRDCDLIGAISSIAHESNQLTGTLACVVLFHGTEEEWFEEREAMLRNFEQNSVEALKEHLRVPGLSLSVMRADMNVRLHDNLMGVKEIVAKHNLDRAIVYVAQKTQPQLESIGMSNVFHGQKFDWTFKPNKESKEGEFELALLAIPHPGLKPVAYTYRVGLEVPDMVSHNDNWPTSVFLDIPGHQKVFEILNAGADDWATASDLLHMFLTETGQLAANDDTQLIAYLPKFSVNVKVAYSEFGERLFQSNRFKDLLPRQPRASITKGDIDEAMCLYGDLMIAMEDPNRDVLFISTSMKGEEFVNVREELDALLATEPKHRIGMMFHCFEPGTVTQKEVMEYILSWISQERQSSIFISTHFKYKEAESE